MNFLLNIDEYKTKTTKQIFESEKKFRPFFIFLLISLFFLFTIYTAALVLIIIRWNNPEYVDYITNQIIENNINSTITPDKIQEAVIQRKMIDIGQASIFVLLILISIIIFIWKLVECYKEKTFSKLSIMASMVIGIIGFWFVINLFTTFFIQNIPTSFDVVFILNIIASSSTIFIWFFVSRYVTLIKKLSLFAERREFVKSKISEMSETIKNTEEYSENNNEEEIPKQKKADPLQNNASDPIVEKLQKLNLEQLLEIADKLSISGANTMSKDELVQRIFVITTANKKPKKQASVRKPKKQLQENTLLGENNEGTTSDN